MFTEPRITRVPSLGTYGLIKKNCVEIFFPEKFNSVYFLFVIQLYFYCSLILYETNESDSGLFSCNAKNRFGEHTVCNTTLVVVGSPTTSFGEGCSDDHTQYSLMILFVVFWHKSRKQRPVRLCLMMWAMLELLGIMGVWPPPLELTPTSPYVHHLTPTSKHPNHSNS